MGSSRHMMDTDHKGRGQLSVKQSLCDTVVEFVVQRVLAYGYSESVCRDLRHHFATMPSRYALTIDPMRHEDVLLHMNLLKEARQAEAHAFANPYESFALPTIHVRKVLLRANGSSLYGGNDINDLQGGKSYKEGVSIPRLPKPVFGSNPNLFSLASSSSNARSIARSNSRSSPPAKSLSPQCPNRFTPPNRVSRWKATHGGSFTGLCDMETDESASSGLSDTNYPYGWEVTVASVDCHGLLTYFTSALSSSSLNLDIKEAHAFSTTDGMALDVFVVEGWRGERDLKVEELQREMLNAITSQLNAVDEMDVDDHPNQVSMEQLRATVDSMAYEDWAVDYNDLELLEKLGGGASGRLYKGIYRGQEVAVKVISLADTPGENQTGTFRAASASELLQMFKQEVAIMRIVRHKNLVQFIGACSCWPKLFIVTELMAGGSVRDMIQRRKKHLDNTTIVKVLRDVARGMDFLHKRGIVHRDLKAANLLIDEHNVVKVCDFGVARMKPNMCDRNSSDPSNCEMTAETGTYRWMAPEVLEHKPYDHKADVYSFGITIWEIVTGDVPYAGLSPLQAAVGVVQRNLRPAIPPSMPPRLASLVQRCWSYNPDDRPEFSEILMVLEECLKPAGLWKRAFIVS